VEPMFDPFDLELVEINKRLAPGFAAGKLPAGWLPWQEPRPTLPIDRFISSLIERNRSPKLRPPSDLQESDGLGDCPYAAARAGVAQAARHAHVETFAKEHRTASNIALKGFSEIAPKVQTLLSEMVEQLGTILEAQEQVFEPELADLPLLRDKDQLLNAIFAVRALEKPFADVHSRRSQNEGNVWRIHFVTSLFGTWWRLTGCDPSPSPSGLFVEFLDVAWYSFAGDDPPAINWERSIRTAKDRAVEEYGEQTPWRIGRLSRFRFEAGFPAA
jgi:hypothetical protein